MTDADVLVVGGGSAGAELAARLSEDPVRRVTLLEAGPAYEPDSFPEILANANMAGGDPQHDWGCMSQPGVIGHPIHVTRGEVLGGSSAVNTAVAMRARPTDFARWGGGESADGRSRTHSRRTATWRTPPPATAPGTASMAPPDLDLHVSATHLFDPTQSPTGGAIVLAVAVTLPDSVGTVSLTGRGPSTPPKIDLNFLARERDRQRMLEGVHLARIRGRRPARHRSWHRGTPGRRRLDHSRGSLHRHERHGDHARRAHRRDHGGQGGMTGGPSVAYAGSMT
jgi:choline dehydrogenase-like flavoprotein